jgi:plasmid stability protein
MEIAMPDVLVRNLKETVVEQLKARASDSGRSLQAELKLILEQSAQRESPRLSRAAYRTLADQIRTTLGDQPRTDSAALLAEDRAR